MIQRPASFSLNDPTPTRKVKVPRYSSITYYRWHMQQGNLSLSRRLPNAELVYGPPLESSGVLVAARWTISGGGGGVRVRIHKMR